jgi:hypothetical protein
MVTTGQEAQAQDGAQEQKQQKTGIHTKREFETNIALIHGFQRREIICGSLEKRMATDLLNTLLDGREYSIRLQPLQEVPQENNGGRYGVDFVLTASVFLVHAADCQIGESCIPSAVDTGGNDSETWMDIAGRFKRLPDGSGWQRIA